MRCWVFQGLVRGNTPPVSTLVSMSLLSVTTVSWCLPVVVASVVAMNQDPPNDAAHERKLGEAVDYLADVKPILVRRCYSCHGPDAEARVADLRVDERSDVTRPRYGDHGVIVPGDAMESELFFRVSTDDEELRMPVDAEPLSDAEIDVIRRWIEQGAPYAQHWSFEGVRDPDVPVVVSSGDATMRDPIDAFILKRLEERGLQPAGDALPASQVRRLAFDLTGLPPKREDVEAFEDDPSDVAWDALVEKYLASEDFGERWARHWLDLMRYAETCGHEFDYAISDAWRYRDYVIRAFNEDLPYDELVREHVAGDLIDPRIDGTTGVNQAPLATGFWHLHQAVHGPVDVRADELERVDNQIDVFSKTFLGLTVSCARCHDHKFDPIMQADYYGLAGYLKSSRRNRTYIDPFRKIALGRDEIRTARSHQAKVFETVRASVDDKELNKMLSSLSSALVANDTPNAIKTEIVFEDFEEDDFGAWSAEGNAFARGPQDASTVREPFKKYMKSRCVNTCDDRPGGAGDNDTGMLTSAPFRVEHPALRYKISGGKFPGETCVDFIVDGQVVISMHGQNDAVLRAYEWDISEYMGQEAQIRIVDKRTGSWGHVVVDDLRFGSIFGYAGSLATPIDVLEEQTDMPRHSVEAWIAAIHDRSDPARPWYVDAGSGPEAAVVLDDGSGSATWFSDGHAWPEGNHPLLNSGFDDSRLHGTLRSRTFPIQHKFVLMRLRGKGTVRVIVDGFMMDQFNPLLFEGLKQDVNTQDWKIHLMNVSAYVGERAWIELIDNSDGSLEVDWIALDDRSNARAPSAQDEIEEIRWHDPEVERWLISNNMLEHLPPAGEALGQVLRADATLARETVPRMPTPKRALTLQDGLAEEEFILLRGNHKTPDSLAVRGLLEVISDPLDNDGPGSNREQLAEAVLAPSNPLTSRVMVNRLWHHLTGRGIVRTTDDFGSLGAMPTHPDLLDHLATDFATDYSMKRMIGRIVRSSTYRRSALALDDEASRVDPTNELLAHARIRRLQGEAIRDALLQVSGRLDSKRFGPPVPIHLTPFMTGRGRPGRNGPLDGEGRRSIYLEVRRNFPVPFLAVFDLPIPTTTIGTRNVSNVPAQALAMMNSPFVHEMSRIWAIKAREQGDLSLLWRDALAREASQEELDRAALFLEEHGQGEDAWTALCHAILNTKEFTYLN